MKNIKRKCTKYYTKSIKKVYILNLWMMIELSFHAEIFHHLIVFVLEHVAMPYVSPSPCIESKGTSIIQAKLHPNNYHWKGFDIDDISKYFLVGFWIADVPCSIGFRIEWNWNFFEPSLLRFSSVQFVPIFYIISFVNLIRIDFLKVDEVEMDGMSIRGKIDYW